MNRADVLIHGTSDPEVIVAECRNVGEALDTGNSFDIANIQILRVAPHRGTGWSGGAEKELRSRAAGAHAGSASARLDGGSEDASVPAQGEDLEDQGTAGDSPEFRVSSIFVLRVRDELIVESRDYADHLAIATATGRLDELVALV